jgi:Predicted integral membrane protein
MAIPQTARMQENLSKTAKLNEVGVGAPFTWLKQGVGDLMAVPVLSLFNGALFAIITYGLWTYLDGSQTLHDVAVPLLAVIVLLLGPISAMSLYDASRRISNGEKPSIGTVVSAAFKTNGSCPSIFLSVILVVLAIAWMMFSPLIYAVFNTGSLNIVNENQTIIQAILAEITSGSNMNFVIAYFSFTAVVGLISFMISWFSFPMVLDTDCDPFTATVTSLRAAMANKLIMLMWVPMVGILVLIGLMTPYFIGLVVVIPVLAHATWHAYKSMIGKLG